MPSVELLEKRLESIAASLSATGQGLALYGLGSSGNDSERLDEWSDLDFFAIVKSGSKKGLLENPAWLTDIGLVEFIFLNTADGFKLLYNDGVFCECAVFEPEELANAVYTEGRVIWKDAAFDENLLVPRRAPARENRTVEWRVNEALTNLYVGLCRCRRGEKISAFRFVQVYAMHQVIELSELVWNNNRTGRDAFNNERRFESDIPEACPFLPAMMGGYNDINGSALAILDFLKSRFPVNHSMEKTIRSLAV